MGTINNNFNNNSNNKLEVEEAVVAAVGPCLLAKI
jgi:hypothetical protein